MAISKKFKYFFSFLAIIIILLYGYWGIVTYKLESYIAYLASESNKNEDSSAIKFSYDELNISGFPLSFDLNFKNLTIKQNEVNIYLGDSSFKLSLLFSAINFMLNEKFFRHTQNNNPFGIENLISFYSVPKLQCKFGWSFLIEAFTGFKHIECEYKDDGFTADVKFRDHFLKSLQSDGNEIKWSKSDEKSDLALHANAYLPNKFASQSEKDKATLDLSGEMISGENIKNVILKELSLNYYNSVIKMNGKVSIHPGHEDKTKNDFSADIDVDIMNYQNFAEDFGILFHIPKFKELVEQFSLINGDNSEFTISKELTQPLQIGSMTYTDILYDIALEKLRFNKQKGGK